MTGESLSVANDTRPAFERESARAGMLAWDQTVREFRMKPVGHQILKRTLGEVQGEGIAVPSGRPIRIEIDTEVGLELQLFDDTGQRVLAATRWRARLADDSECELTSDQQGCLSLRPVPLGTASLTSCDRPALRPIQVPAQRALRPRYLARVPGFQLAATVVPPAAPTASGRLGQVVATPAAAQAAQAAERARPGTAPGPTGAPVADEFVLAVQLFDDAGQQALAGSRWLARLADGSERELTADPRGCLLSKPVPLGEVLLTSRDRAGLEPFQVPVKRDPEPRHLARAPGFHLR